MGGGAEAVDAEALGVAGFDQTSIADQSGAQQRRGLCVGVRVWNGKTITLIGNGVFRIAAVKCVAGEFCFVAEILLAVLTIRAFGAGPTEPRHADSLADSKTSNVFAQSGDLADDFMTWDERQFRLGQFAIDNMEVGAAHRAGSDLDQ